MNINRNSFVIKESNKKPFKQEKFREQVRFLFNGLNIDDIKQTDKFLKNLHNVDYEFLFDKKFTIQYKKRSSIRTFFSGELAYFNFKEKRDINSQIQKICIKTPSLYKTPIAKKASILDNYIHESTHEKQYDRSLANIEKNEYNFILDTFFQKYNKIEYRYNLVEIDVRFQIIKRFVELFKNNDIPLTLSTLYMQIVNINEIFIGLDLKFDKNQKFSSFNLRYIYEGYFGNYLLQYNKHTNKKEFLNNFRQILDKKLLECEENAKYIVENCLQLMEKKYKNEYVNIISKLKTSDDMSKDDLIKYKLFSLTKELHIFLREKCSNTKKNIGKIDTKVDETLNENFEEIELI